MTGRKPARVISCQSDSKSMLEWNKTLVFATVFFNLLLSAIHYIFHHVLRPSDGIPFERHLVWNQTKMRTFQICELQYVSNCAFMVYSSESVLQTLSTISTMYQSCGLHINTSFGFHTWDVPLKPADDFSLALLSSTASSTLKFTPTSTNRLPLEDCAAKFLRTAT